MKFSVASLSLLLLTACSAPQDFASSPSLPAPATADTAGRPVQLPIPINHAPVPQDATPQSLRVVGTEPFWAVQVNGDALTFTTPEDQRGLQLRGVRVVAADGGFAIAGRSGQQGFSLQVDPGNCSDGMSDTAYTMTAEFRLGETTYRGCARPADTPPGAGDAPNDPG